MPESIYINTTGSALYRAGKLVEGVSNIATQGASAPEVDVTTLISEKREYFVGIADPGSVTFTMNFNPADPVHKAMYDTLGSESFAAYELTLAGEIVNGIKTKNGRVLDGDLYTTTVTSAGVMTVNASKTNVPYGVGRYLDDQAGGGGAEDLIIQSGDYSVKDAVKWNVVKADDGTAPTAKNTEQHYKVVEPAQVMRFSAFVQAMPLPSQGREAALIGNVTLRVSGDAPISIGTPNIA